MNEPFYEPPRARSRDLSTAHHAAASVRKTHSEFLRGEILRALRHYGPMTDEGIAGALAQFKHTPSGLRSRRAELVAAGLIELESKDGRTAAGRRCAIWRAATVIDEQTLF